MSRKILILLILTFVISTFTLMLSFNLFKKVNLQDRNPNTLEKKTINNPSLGKKGSKNIIVEFMDFKCPYCKSFHKKMYKSIKGNYVSNSNTEYRIVNASILGKESFLASRASYAVYIHSPKNYWNFYNKLFDLQYNEKKTEFSYKKIDKLIDNISISQETKKNIKQSYRQKGSKSWKLAKRDQKLYKEFKNEYVPSLYVNGRFIKNTYSKDEIKKELK